MLSLFKRLYFATPVPQQPENPADKDVVVTDRDVEDGFTRIEARKMTYAEVASLAVPDSAVHASVTRVHGPESPALRAPIQGNCAAADDEHLYGDVANQFAINERERSKKTRRGRKSRRARAAVVHA